MTASSVALLERIVRKKRWIASRHSVSLGHARHDPIFVAGTGRSGTTWLAEMLARDTRRRLIFEPFRHDRVPLWRPAAERQYLRPDNTDTPLLEPARTIVRGEFRDDWSDYLNSRLLTIGNLIKDIRANLILAWLHRQFGPFPVIFMIRNPESVARSWQREEWSFSPADLFLTQPSLLEDHLAPFVERIERATSPLEQFAVLWCVENLVPMRQFQTGEMLVLFYEDLLLHPDRELGRIAEFAGLRTPIRRHEALTRPSATTTPGVRYVSQAERLGPTNRLDRERRPELAAILEEFGLADVYGSDGLPTILGSEIQSRVANGGSSAAMRTPT